jgi:hypothetical protein
MAGNASGKLVISLQVIEQLGIILVLIFCITTCIANGGATRIWHVAVYSPHHHLRSPRLLELGYISHVSFQNLSIDITIFSINDTFYVIQDFHSPVGHDGVSSSHRNELTPRDSSGHSNQPSNGNNTWVNLKSFWLAPRTQTWDLPCSFWTLYLCIRLFW